MVSCHCKINDNLFVERDDTDYAGNVRVVIHEYGNDTPSTTRSNVLSTFELGSLAAHLSLVYYRRTGKSIYPAVLGSVFKRDIVMLAAYETDEQGNGVDLPLSNEDLAAHVKPPPIQAIDASDCVFCNGVCTGECL